MTRAEDGAFALVGDPVGGSVSPAMMEAAFGEAGLDGTYRSVTVPAGTLAGSWASLRGRFRGLNVTRPLKEEVIPLLDRLEPSAAAAGSVNTVAIHDEGSAGHSTDGPGFLSALRRAGVGPSRRAVILGTGGAARAVAVALRDEGAEVRVTGRNREAGTRLEADLGAPDDGGTTGVVTFVDVPLLELLAWADLLVNATPVGGEAAPEATPVPDRRALHAGLAVMDLVYRPRRTRLLADAARAGCEVVEGIEMLVEQGARSFEIWTGRPAPAEAMRRAAVAALDRQPAGTRGGPAR